MGTQVEPRMARTLYLNRCGDVAVVRCPYCRYLAAMKPEGRKLHCRCGRVLLVDPTGPPHVEGAILC